MTEQEKRQNQIDIILGKKRVIRAKKAPSIEEKANAMLVVRNHADLRKMSDSERKAAILRGC